LQNTLITTFICCTFCYNLVVCDKPLHPALSVEFLHWTVQKSTSVKTVNVQAVLPDSIQLDTIAILRSKTHITLLKMSNLHSSYHYIQLRWPALLRICLYFCWL